jgi:Tol biopolymer transport system component/predicted Ser/Thr protein kinase
MSPEQWREVEQLYHAALERKPEEREAFLEAACRANADLRGEVESLLGQGGSLLDHPAWELCNPVPGSRVGVYEIGVKIGEGGMGLVYRARDTKLNRTVAIKVLPAALAQDPGRLARFEREAKVLASLNHPNIAQIYSVEDRALVMELVEGETLKGPLPLKTALDYAGQIAEALEAAHDKGIIHRDLKPENIKVTPQGVVKVLDFGLAAIRPESDTTDAAGNSPALARATELGMILGTPAYMSPEQARGQPVDRRTDIWAFGCVLYEMLTGQRAFPGQTVSDTLATVIAKEPDIDKVPAKVRRLVQTCLEKDPKQRLQAIGDWRLLIEDVSPPGKAASNRVAWATAAVLGLALAAAVSFAHFRRESTPDQQVRFQVLAPEQTRFGNVFSLSPDGRQLAFTATSPKGESMLWIRPLDALDARPLHGTEGAAFMPFWSPDSRYLAFATGGKLEKIDISGGPPQFLCEAPQIVTAGSWSPNGTILFSSNSGHAIWKVSASGGAAVPVTKLADGDAYHVAPQFLPDGHHFIYVRLSKTAVQGVYVGSIDAKAEEQDSRLVVSADSVRYAEAPQGGGGYFLFLRERTLLAQPFDVERRSLRGDPITIAEPIGLYATRGYFSVSANGVLAYRQGASEINRLTWFDRTGKAVGYAAEPGRFEDLALSPDGSRLAAQRPAVSAIFDIWLIDLARATSTRFTFGPGLHVNPVWSPDGKRIAYALERTDGADVFQKDSNGTRPEEALFHHNDNAFPQDWSSDGRSLLLAVRGARTGDDLWVLPLTGAREPAPFLQTPFNESQAQFSPDGRWVAYMSDVSGQPEIYVRPFPAASSNGGQWLISTGGGFQPRWRGDGKELFYLSGSRVMAVDISTTPNFKASVPKVLFEVPIYVSTGPTASLHTWVVSADGKRFLINVDMSANRAQPISVVLNWAAALKK